MEKVKSTSIASVSSNVMKDLKLLEKNAWLSVRLEKLELMVLASQFAQQILNSGTVQSVNHALKGAPAAQTMEAVPSVKMPIRSLKTQMEGPLVFHVQTTATNAQLSSESSLAMTVGTHSSFQSSELAANAKTISSLIMMLQMKVAKHVEKIA